MKYCTNCGLPNDDGNRFCEGCGTPFDMLGEFPGADTYVVGRDAAKNPGDMPAVPSDFQPQGDENQLLRSNSQPQGDETQLLRSNSQPQGDETQLLRSNSQPQGDETQLLSPNSQPQGDETQLLRPNSQPQGDETQLLRPNSQPQGDETQLLRPDSQPQGEATQPLPTGSAAGAPAADGTFRINFTPEQPASQNGAPQSAPFAPSQETAFQPKEEQKKPQKKWGRLIACICAAVVVLGGLGTGAWFMFFNQGEESQPLQEALSLGDRYMEDLDYNSAVEAYNEALVIDPKNTQAYMGLAQAYSGIQDYDQAEVAYRQLLELDTGNTEGYRQLAELYIRLEKLEEAKELLESAIQQTDSEELQELYGEMTPQAPTFSLQAGSYDTYQEVSIQAENSEHIIYYTVDGSEPSVDSSVYTEPVILTSGRTQLKAMVISSRGYQSDTASAEYDITVTPTEVTFADPVIEEAVRSELDLNYNERITTDHTAQVRQLSIVGYNTLSSQYYSQSPTFTEDQYFINYSTYSTMGQVTTLEDLSTMPFLKRLHLAWQENTSLSGLASATNLEELSLIRMNMTTLEPVSGLTKLKKLNVEWNRISDLTPLSGLTSLTSLNVWGNQVTDLTPISGLKALTYLDFSRNKVQDISPVAQLNSLESLWMYDNEVSDFSPLEGLEQLRVLMIRDNPITDKTALQKVFPRLGRTDVDIREEEVE